MTWRQIPLAVVAAALAISAAGCGGNDAAPETAPATAPASPATAPAAAPATVPGAAPPAGATTPGASTPGMVNGMHLPPGSLGSNRPRPDLTPAAGSAPTSP